MSLFARYSHTQGVMDDGKAFAPRSDGEWVLIGYASCSLDITGYILYEMHSGRQATFDLGSVKFVEDVFPCVPLPQGRSTPCGRPVSSPFSEGLCS